MLRGLNDNEKRMQFRGLLRECKTDIVCLQETKMDVISREVVHSVWGCIHIDWLYLGSRGASRGILLMWDGQEVETIEACVGNFVVACSFITENFEWAFVGIYGPNDDVERRCL